MRTTHNAGAVALGLVAALCAQAEDPTVAQLLAARPVQPGIVCDTPTPQTIDKCKVEAIKTPYAGWTLIDGRGLIVRKIVDTNGDATHDRWSFYMNGQEVYRDSDTNGNGRIDQSRWYHSAGSRWGVDRDEDGKIDYWRAISAAEATAEAIAALTTRDVPRMQAVLLDQNDASQLGADSKCVERVRAVHEHLADQMQKASGTLPKGAQWVRMDAQQPIAAPADEIGTTKDPVLFHNATIIVEAGGQSHFLRAVEIVEVGDTWKLTDIPAPINPDRAVETSGVLIPAMQQTAVVANAGAKTDQMIEDNNEVRKLAETLRQLDEHAPTEDRQGKELVEYHIRRSDLCARIGAKSQKRQTREYWYELCADSLNAAAQTGEYPKAIEMLQQYAAEFQKHEWAKDLAAYFKYRALNSAYAIELNKEADHAKAQEAFLAQLSQFLKDYPDAPDAPDALWQLGNGMEFLGKEDIARDHYRRLATQFVKSAAGVKGVGALRRLESIGQPFKLSGGSLTGKEQVDTGRYRGKVLLVAFWSTWCEPCKAEMPRMQKLREKLAPQGFEILGVCLDGDKDLAQRYIAENRYNWPQLFEPGSMDSEPAQRYGIISLPYLMLIDTEGRVVQNNLQFHQLERELERIVSKPSNVK